MRLSSIYDMLLVILGKSFQSPKTGSLLACAKISVKRTRRFINWNKRTDPKAYWKSLTFPGKGGEANGERGVSSGCVALTDAW